MFIYNPLFKQKIIDDSIEHAKEEWPNEACGAIINDEYVRFENKADDISNSFLIKDNYFTRRYINDDVQAVIHSHNDYPMASKQDQIQQQEMNIPFGIINLKNKSVTHYVFFGDQVPIAPLEGRFFFYGAVFDCFSLARDYIKIKYNVIPPNPPRDFAFWYKNVSMFEEYIQENRFPFKFIDLDEIREDDFLLYNIHGTQYVNHIAIMKDRGLVLHHFYNEISCLRPITYYREYLQLAVRYNPDWEGWNDNSLWSISEEISKEE